MSYLPANLLRMAEAADGAAKWFLYRSTDPLSSVTGPGYITDALDHEMSVGDLVLVQEVASPVYQWLEVAALMDGAADLVDGLKPPDGLAPITSPRLNGTPLSPTPGMADATTRIATTEWVQAQAYLRDNRRITLTEDVTGTGTTVIKTKVTGLGGNPIGTTQPQDGEVLAWDGSVWSPAPPLPGPTGPQGEPGPPGPVGPEGPPSVGSVHGVRISTVSTTLNNAVANGGILRFDTVHLDSDGFVPTTAPFDTITIPTGLGGIYILSAWSSGSGTQSTTLGMGILLNGTQLFSETNQSISGPGSVNYTLDNGAVEIGQLAAGDTIQLRNNSVSPGTNVFRSTILSLVRLEPAGVQGEQGLPGEAAAAGTLGQVQIHAAGGVLGGVTMAGDATWDTATGALALTTPPGIAAGSFGAVGDGIHDDTTAIQAAIDSLPVSGGTVLLAAGKTYLISAPLHIGNGSATAVSTRTGVVLRAAPGGVGFYPNSVYPGTPVIHQTTANPVIVIQGPLQGWGLQDLVLRGPGLAGSTGVRVVSAGYGDCRNLTILDVQTGIYSTAVTALPAGAINIDSLHTYWRDINIRCADTNPNTGIVLDGTSAGNTCFNQFENLQVAGSPSAGKVHYGVYLVRCDGNLFENYHLAALSSGGGFYGIVFDYTVNDLFPCGNTFNHFDTYIAAIINSGTPNASAAPNHLSNLSSANAAVYPSLANVLTDHNTYLPLTGGTVSGELDVAGDLLVTGGVSGHNFVSKSVVAGYQFEARDAPGTDWLWYATGGSARLWRGIDRLTVDSGGNLVATGNLLGQRGHLGSGTIASNWLETLRPGASTWSSLVALSPASGYGGPPIQVGVVGAMRSSDPTIDGARLIIGTEGVAINDNTSIVHSAWAGYFEAWRKAGCMAGSQAIGLEIDIAECNSGITANILTPYAYPANFTAGLWIGSGANLSAEVGTPVYPASVALGITPNGAIFRKGVVVLANALDTAIGVGGNGVAIELARGQSVRWLNSAGGTDAEMWGDATGLHMGPITGDFAIGGNLYTASSVGTGAAFIEIGQGRAGAGIAYIDLHTSVGSDYDLRLYREAGVNGNALLTNAGTGGLVIVSAGGVSFSNVASGLTAAPGTNTTQFATTAFVGAAITAAPNKTITLSGDISGSGTAAITTTLPNVNANIGTFNNITINAKGQATAGSNTAYLTASGVSGMTAGQIPIAATATTITSSGNLSGAVTTSGSLATTLANNAVATAHITNANVTYAKIQNVAANRLLGNSTGSAASVAEIALPLAVGLGGTGATTLALNAGPPGWGLSGTFLLTTGTTVTPMSDAGGTVGNWGGGAIIAAQVANSAMLDLVRVNGSLASPTALLNNQLIGNIAFDGSTGVGTMTANARANIQCYTTENWSATVQGTRLDFRTTPTGGTATATTMTLDGSGNLTVAGGVKFGASANPQLGLQFTDYTCLASPDGLVDGRAIYVSNATAGSVIFYRNNTHTFQNVGAGTTYASMTATGTTFGTPTGGAKGAGTVNAVSLYLNGTVVSTSDARLKRDIEALPENCLGLVAAIPPKRFRFNPLFDDGGNEQGPPGFSERCRWGFVAQDVQAVMPDAVEEDGEGILGLSTSDLLAALWKAVQELSEKVASR